MKPIQQGLRACFGSLMGKELYRVEDDLGFVVVLQRGSKRVLSFDSYYEQSSVLMSKPYYLFHEYTQLMLLGLLFVDAKHVTLLGLGGGGLAHCLSHFYPHMTIQVVELRQAVIDVAYEWFNLPRVPYLKVCQGDAGQYLANVESDSTDIIFSDLYEAQGMSELQVQQDYIDTCYKALNSNGWLVLNFHTLPDKNGVVMQNIHKLFSEVYVGNVVKGNWVLFCGKSTLQFDNEVLHQRVEALVEQVGMPLMNYYRSLRKLEF